MDVSRVRHDIPWKILSFPPNVEFWSAGSTNAELGIERTATGYFVAMPHWFTILLTATVAALPWFKWQFSLRTLLIATTLVAVALGRSFGCGSPRHNISTAFKA
jgi:hypothetical protein